MGTILGLKIGQLVWSLRIFCFRVNANLRGQGYLGAVVLLSGVFLSTLWFLMDSDFGVVDMVVVLVVVVLVVVVEEAVVVVGLYVVVDVVLGWVGSFLLQSWR